MANTNNLKSFYDYGLPHTNVKDSELIMENIEFLYEKMQACTREASYFDLYRITSVVNQPSELQGAINALPAFETLVVNAPVDLGNGEVYNIGDLVVKHQDNTITRVPAQRGGIFFPESIKKLSSDNKNFAYTINFKYAQVSPTTELDEVVEGTGSNQGVWNAQYAKNVLFKDIQGGAAKSPYNEVHVNESAFTVKAELLGSEYIAPIVHAYLKDSNNMLEEVYADQQITLSNNQYVINISAPPEMLSKVVVK